MPYFANIDENNEITQVMFVDDDELSVYESDPSWVEVDPNQVVNIES